MLLVRTPHAEYDGCCSRRALATRCEQRLPEMALVNNPLTIRQAMAELNRAAPSALAAHLEPCEAAGEVYVAAGDSPAVWQQQQLAHGNLTPCWVWRCEACPYMP